MNIALIGYGRMGRAVEQQAAARGHNVTARIDIDNRADLDSPGFAEADVVIEFSAPSAAPANIVEALRRGKPVVSGTTGWAAELPQVERVLADTGGTLLWSSNYSIGVALFRAISRRAAELISPFPQYTPGITETHHVHKLDAPSGTAVTIAEELLASSAGRFTEWTRQEPAPEGSVPVTARRRGEVPGIHEVEWHSPVDCITLRHEAFTRDGFALGAVVAAERLLAHPGSGMRSLDELILS